MIFQKQFTLGYSDTVHCGLHSTISTAHSIQYTCPEHSRKYIPNNSIQRTFVESAPLDIGYSLLANENICVSTVNIIMIGRDNPKTQKQFN